MHYSISDFGYKKHENIRLCMSLCYLHSDSLPLVVDLPSCVIYAAVTSGSCFRFHLLQVFYVGFGCFVLRYLDACHKLEVLPNSSILSSLSKVSFASYKMYLFTSEGFDYYFTFCFLLYLDVQILKK